MLKNRFVVILTVLVLFSIAIGLHFIGGEKNESYNDITIMPEDAALVIETKNFASILDNFNTKNQFNNVFSNVAEWENFFTLSEIVDTIIKSNADIEDMFDGKKLTMAARVGIENKLEFIYSIPVFDSDNEDLILKTISAYQNENQSISQQIYEKKVVYNFNQINPAKRLFSYAIVGDLFIISPEKALIEETIRKLENPDKITENNGFTKVSNTAGDNADMNIYVNYAYFPNLFKSILSNRKNIFYDFFKNFADWTEVDMRYKEKSLFMSGFTYVNNNKKRYLKVLQGQSSLPNEFLSALPINTAAFVALNISNSTAWKKNYDKYLQEIGEYASVMQNIDSVSKRFLPDVKNLFFANIEGAVCISWIDKNTTLKELEIVGIMELRNASNFANILEASEKNSINESDEKINNYKVFKILEPKLFEYLFGDVFSELQANYCIIHEDRLIVAKSTDVLKFYLRKFETKGSLKDDKNFNSFSKSLSSESNIYAYINFELSTNLLLSNLNTNKASLYKSNIDKFNSIYALAVQYGVSKHGIYTNFCTNINANAGKKSKNSWEIRLDTSFSMKPAIVKNHATGNNEVLIQDHAHKLSFISSEGKIRWTKQIDSKILGQIHQVDRYKNSKIQYLFNTRSKLYLVDRNGDDVEGFPVLFTSPATSACAVFDYDNNLKYRILVASSDKKMQMYDIEGKVLQGWLFTQTQGIVTMPAQHFVDAGKDYIIFADYNNTYIVSRKGEMRVEPKAKFNKSPHAEFFFEKSSDSNNSRFVTTGQNSYVYFIYLDGSVKKMHLGNFSDKHKFMYIDIDGTGKEQFIIADKNVLYAFNRDKTLRFKKEFKGNIENSLNTYKFGNYMYLGVAPAGERKIYLINPKGKIISGFPLLGASGFSITKLDKKDKNKQMDIITGNIDNYLFNYKLSIN